MERTDTMAAKDFKNRLCYYGRYPVSSD